VTSAPPATGWLELFDQYPFFGVCGLEGQMRRGSTSAQVAWTDVNDAHLAAEELIGATLLLASAKAGSFITGIELIVDGGFNAMTI